jgi:carbamoyl-phosphate synthase large subunit
VLCLSAWLHRLEQGIAVSELIGSYPLIIRPAFTLGGSGGGIAYNRQEFEAIVTSGIQASAVNQVLIERSLLGWKEYEVRPPRLVRDVACSRGHSAQCASPLPHSWR